MRLFSARLVSLAAASLVAAAVLLSAAPARAQETEAEKRATELWRKATAQYDLGNFDKAIELYKKGYEEAPASFFLYNIAQSYRQKGDCTNAIFFYKRYLSRSRYSAKRDLKVEAQVADIIKDLEANCKQTEAIKKKPPDKTMPGDEGDAGKQGTDTGKKPDDGKQPTDTGKQPDDGKQGTDTGKKPDDGKQVAQADDDDDGDYDDDDDFSNAGSVTSAVYHPTKVISSVEVGTAFLGIGSEYDVPNQFSLRLSGGYPMTFGKIGADFGVLFNLTPVPWENLDLDVKATAMLTSLLANVGVTYPVIPKLSVRAELGLGGQFFSGLSRGNPFTAGGAETTGALGVFNIRIGLGAEYAITNNIVASASPVIYSYSPAPSDMRADIDSLTRFELMVGVGYRL